MDPAAFRERFSGQARRRREQRYGNTVAVSGLLAVGNVCRNRCEYCGLRAPNHRLSRYRLGFEEISRSLDGIREQGISRLFLISGEDPGADVDMLCRAISFATQGGFRVMLGLGVPAESHYRAFRDAGAQLYALKFETSNPEIFARMKPDISFEDRLSAIRRVRPSGMRLGSGNIVGLPGQTVEDLVRDIQLMLDLEIDWAPIVPYLPSPATPLGRTQPMGSVDLLLREIALLRLHLPEVLITAGQPRQDSSLGFADPEGTKDALQAGGNLLFVDLTPRDRQEDFAITPQRVLPRLEAIDRVLAELELVRE